MNDFCSCKHKTPLQTVPSCHSFVSCVLPRPIRLLVFQHTHSPYREHTLSEAQGLSPPYALPCPLPQMTPLVPILASMPPVNDVVIQYLLPSDSSALLYTYRITISDTQRRRYSDPIRQIGQHEEWRQAMIKYVSRFAPVGKEIRDLIDIISVPDVFLSGRRAFPRQPI